MAAGSKPLIPAFFFFFFYKPFSFLDFRQPDCYQIGAAWEVWLGLSEQNEPRPWVGIWCLLG